jgi:hypothetical protein
LAVGKKKRRFCGSWGDGDVDLVIHFTSPNMVDSEAEIKAFPGAGG